MQITDFAASSVTLYYEMGCGVPLKFYAGWLANGHAICNLHTRKDVIKEVCNVKNES